MQSLFSVFLVKSTAIAPQWDCVWTGNITDSYFHQLHNARGTSGRTLMSSHQILLNSWLRMVIEEIYDFWGPTQEYRSLWYSSIIVSLSHPPLFTQSKSSSEIHDVPLQVFCGFGMAFACVCGLHVFVHVCFCSTC